MANDQAAVAAKVEQPDLRAALEAFMAYNKSFLALQPELTAPFLHEPAIFISRQGVVVMPDEAHRVGVLARTMQDLKARRYKYTELKDLSIRQLGEGLALVTANGYRYETDGTAMECYSLTYTLRKAEGGWKIISAIIHDIGMPPPQTLGDLSIQ